MKNHFFLIAVLFVFISAGINAQEKKMNHWSNTVETRFGFDPQVGTSDFLFMEVTASPGYKFNDRFSLRLPVELSAGMFNLTSTKNCDILGTVGLNAAYNAIKNDNFRLELNLSGGSTYLKSDWSYMYGDFTVRFGYSGLGVVNPYIGLGVKYYHSYQMTMTDKVAICVTFGIWMF